MAHVSLLLLKAPVSFLRGRQPLIYGSGLLQNKQAMAVGITIKNATTLINGAVGHLLPTTITSYCRVREALTVVQANSMPVINGLLNFVARVTARLIITVSARPGSRFTSRPQAKLRRGRVSVLCLASLATAFPLIARQVRHRIISRLSIVSGVRSAESPISTTRPPRVVRCDHAVPLHYLRAIIRVGRRVVIISYCATGRGKRRWGRVIADFNGRERLRQRDSLGSPKNVAIVVLCLAIQVAKQNRAVAL